MKNFLIFLLLLISLNINCQNIKFIYQLEQKFNIENNQLIADSLCLFNMAKDAKIDEIKIKFNDHIILHLKYKSTKIFILRRNY